MKISNPAFQKIVAQVGLHLNDYDGFNFKGYISHSYKDSETEARDEVHRMYEHVVLHKESGLRVSYLTSESYFGETVEYIVIDCFVFTRENQKQSITAIDLEKHTFETAAGTLPFSAVRNTVDEKD
ncbi:MAG: hypothetical protein ABL895_20750 [Cyclobacteriaceae bacterium]